MSNLLNVLKSILPSVETQTQRDEAYLSEAVDLYDLEHRMRDIDSRGRANWSPIVFGLYSR